MAEQLAVKAPGLLGSIQEDAVLGRAGRAEIVGDAADGDHQRIVGDPGVGYGGAIVKHLAQADHAVCAVDTRQAPMQEPEVVPLGLGDVVQLVRWQIQRTRRDLMQQGLPDMGQLGVDQGDGRPAALAERASEAGREFEPAGAAADDDNTM